MRHTTRWDDAGKSSLSLPDFFKVVFSNIPLAQNSGHIYFSFYSNWPTYQLEDATQALNVNWEQTLAQSGERHKLYRLDIRIIVCLLGLCYLVCAFFVRLTIKNVIIIGLAFLGIAYGSKTWIDFVIQGDEQLAIWVKLTVFTIIALGFPAIAVWNPKDIFTTELDPSQDGE